MCVYFSFAFIVDHLKNTIDATTVENSMEFPQKTKNGTAFSPSAVIIP